MKDVKEEVYTRLVKDILTTLVLPALGESPSTTECGFIALEVC
jgi:hypothetical protein|eukprot:COSAG02_NODE_3876_length_6103_cov_2.989007_6_plen_43_part_00